MSPRPPQERSVEPLVAVFAVVGLLLGCLGVLGWRFATSSLLTEYIGIQPPPPPPMEDGKTGYMWVVDGYSYFEGPHWFPATGWFLTLGTALALVVSALCVATGWRVTRHHEGNKWFLALTLSGFGGLYGLAASVAGRIFPPTFYSIVLPEPRDPADPYPDSPIVHFDLDPTLISFTAIGFTIGALLSLLLLASGFRVSRTYSESSDRIK
ncbi:hypothetical protein B2J88_00690 [Rhodococcus sp. SRB_17]|nr:hypothetical protein [Rhodococcus sp. SRB_17]